MSKQKKALVCGAGGFIGGHLVNRLKDEGYWVKGVDLKENPWGNTNAHDFEILDLRDHDKVEELLSEVQYDEIYQLAADMGGAGYIFTGDNDADVMHNSATINLNIAKLSVQYDVGKVFYSSSACMYPEGENDPKDPSLPEDCAYPANPDSEYGWEKLFSERMFFAFNRNYDLDVRVARFHNIFGPRGSWVGGKEKAPAALCRKAADAEDGGEIEIWGDGEQQRSFLYIDECLEGIRRLMESDFKGPVNIGSDELISINDFVDMICDIAGKDLTKNHVEGPEGVRARNSSNELIEEKLGWRPTQPLREGIEITYSWIEEQLEERKAAEVAE